ncbi:ABC transporter ATP-binding protein [Brevundimonas vitis]|uniref:ABC transporter ATP-binding protein n=1 Tax=Brevundimonas vitisensis TaxID=2800818 RepID=A0ABX7BNY0_9CAUL|nr:ABC transporter ATP-binding protein [Brevundimonas vitisensis]QQQ18951.1 ABC transporter ATP-binding protein [Brevundimonas vitisensis]
MSLLALNGVSARLGPRPVLTDVDLTVRAGELVALCGPNGAGKTSVLRLALGLIPTMAGEARLGGDLVGELGPQARALRAAYLPQERHIAWNMPAIEIAALGAPFLAGPESLARARAALDQVHAGDLADRGVADMSGGERARVLLARALVADAPLLLADEPVAGLDPAAQLLVMGRLRSYANRGRGVLVSLHDLTLAARHADRIIVLDRGRVVADAVPSEALSDRVLRSVFGIAGQWLKSEGGPTLSILPYCE